MSFHVGQQVSWRSQANGSAKEKNGVVHQIVPAGQRPEPGLIDGAGFGRDHESYIIIVRGPRGGVKYYWPRVSQLKSAASEAASDATTTSN